MPSITRGSEPAAEEDFLGALYKGGELLAAGKIVEAREHLEKAHGLEPKNEKAQNLLGLTYFKLGLFDDAARVYELLVRENPVDPTLRVNLGLVYLKTNALERCIKEFETATDLDPGHQKAHNYLGLALAQAGEYAKAREHFHAAGSEAMAEKMTKALMARAEAEEVSMTVKSPPPATAHAVTGKPATEVVSAPPEPPAAEPPPLPEPPAPPVADHEESTWDVMSDEEVPSDAYVTPEEAMVPVAPAPPPAPSGPRLDSDWGAHFAPAAEPPPPAAPDDEMRFAEDEGPSAATLAPPEEVLEADVMPVLDETAVQVDVTSLDTSVAQAIDDEAMVVTTGAPTPQPAPPRAPAWLTMEAAEAANAPAETQWVTEGLNDVPLPTAQPTVEAEVSWGAAGDPGTSGEAWATEGASQAGAADTEGYAPSADAWADGSDAGQAASAEQATDAGGSTEAAQGYDATAQGYDAAAQGYDATAQGYDAAAQGYDAAGQGYDAAAQGYDAAAQGQDAAAQGYDAAAQGYDAGMQGQDAAAQGYDATAQGYDAAAQGYDAAAQGYDAAAQGYDVAAQEQDAPAQAYDAAGQSYDAAAQGQDATAQGQDATAQGYDATAESGAWEAPPSEAAASADTTSDTWPEETGGYSGGPIPPVEMPPAVESAPADVPLPNPSGPDLPIDVAPPIEASALPPPLPSPAEGYHAMRSQKLIDLGAASGWVREPTDGPFHMSSEGLAVTVAGEMLARMTGLVAVVGGLEVKPEVRRKRGRPTAEPFGAPPAQLQRLSGNGLVYMEPGRHRFFAVDLTDTNGASVDDDGAYLREEAVFAFEEPVAFENGHITGEGLALELVHLKGTGKALLQLEGTMKAMPIPPGAPMVVPLKRLVGWFGRVTPRLMGFGGQGAVELKGDGYALLETPGDRA